MSRRLLDLEEDHPRLVRARANWDVLVERKLRASIAQARPGAGGGLLQPISLAIGNARVDTVLSVADRLRKYSQQVARICCEYAYRLAQDLDPNSQNRGMLQLKTGLLSIITQKKSKREGQAIDRRNDAKFIIDFYKTYRKKIDKLEALEEQWHERTNQGDGAPAAESKKRVAKIKEGYLTFRILNEVLDALIPDRTEKKALLAADQQEQGQGRSDIESDAARASEYKSYNILPLETLNATHLFEFLPQITGAQSALYLGNGDRGRQQDHLPALPRTVPRPNQRSEDMLDLLQYIFGFQKDNVNNQREHIILLLANTHARVSHPDGQANDLAVQRMHDKVLENYQRWCTYLRKESACRRGNSVQVQLLLTALYLLIWGEAGNIRFLPECLCYIFHNMAFELLQQLDNTVAVRARGIGDGDHEFLDQVIKPLYGVVAAEAKYGKGKTHTDWRNYDDLNEYFWSDHCFTLGWPMLLNQPFFTKPSEEPARRWGGQRRRMGKTLFAEHRTSFHIYHSFHRLWIFFLIMLQILVFIAFTSKLDGWHRARLILSFGPSYVSLKLFQSLLDFWMMLGAYKSTRGQNIARVFVRFLWFLALSSGVIFLYVMVMREADLNKTSALLNIYILVIGVYTAVEVATGIISRISAVRLQVDKFETWGIVRFISWVHQERFYVGRGMYESTKDCVIYVFFWVVILAAKFSFSYFFQIQPLVNPTRVIYSKKITEYNWFSFLSKDHHNMWTLGSLWGPVVLIYFLDTQVWYTVFSAIWGGIDGARMHLGEIRSLNMLSNRFRSFPEEFVKKLTPAAIRSQITSGAQSGNSDAQRFAPIWNEVIRNLRDEDYISNRERDLLLMPKNNGSLQEVQWPLFLLANKIALATNLSGEHKGAQQELEAEISDDDYMLSAVKEAYASVRQMLLTLVQDPVEQTWVRNVFQLIDEAKAEKALVGDLNLKKLGGPDGLVSKLGVLTKKLKKLKGISEEKIAKKHNKITETLARIFETVMRDVLGLQLREKFISSDIMRRAREEPQLLFSDINWLSTVEKHEEIVRLHELLTIKVSASSVPKNDEARRRLEFFSNSLFMGMPATPSLQKMFSFSVLTPYYEEDVMFSYAALNKPNEDGITILFYLQKIFPDEWNNYLERVFHKESQKKHADLEKHFADYVKLRRKNLKDKEEKVDTHEEGPILQLRLWASYRGQTLARTVRGMMYYRSALVLLSELEDPPARDEEAGSRPALRAMPPSLRAQSVADMKFSYVVSCQIYGKLKKSEGVAELQKAADIGYLLRSYEGLRVAYIHSEEITVGNAPTKLFFSKLVKADAVGMEQEIYSIKLPGDPLLGEGKPENQNHAIVFTRGDAIQTIDMNQDNYFEETVKMRNLLQEFDVHHGLRKPSILGVREHVFTGSVSSLGWFMSNQETSFVTLGQRVLAKPLRVRMHYGHPDVFDRIFHISRGGISKASKVINISEDIYAGFNSTLRQGNVTHHEYIQVGKGRDVGLNQIAIFEGKVAGGNGEQVLSRDIYRLGQLFDPVRMLSFFYTSVGFYICTMMTVLTVYVFLYGKAYLALSGVETTLTGEETNNKALQTALNTQFLFQIGVFTAVPMIMGAILEQGVLKAFTGFVTMQLQAASVFFTFSLGTRTHYFGRTILHGGAKYRSTGRGFVVQHISFAENYRLFSRSHFVKGFEIALLLIVYAAYGSSKGTVSYILLTFSSWFLALSWLYAPFLFNPSGFEWQKAVEDFDKWSNWMFYKGGVGVKLDESWEAWWEDEMSHITSWWGRFWEIVFSLRFLIFQYGVVYSLNVTGKDNSLYVYGYSWAALVGLLVLWKVFTIGQRAAANAQLLVRAFQTVILVGILTSLVVLIIRTSLTLADVFAAFFLALLPTGWLILSICVALKPVVKPLGLWESVRSLARSYDALFGMLIFVPIAVLSWFPFVSTFQTRLVFNQAFSRGLEISLILSGKQEDESEESRERIVCLGGCKPKIAGQDIPGQDIPEQDRVVCFQCKNVLGQAKKQD